MARCLTCRRPNTTRCCTQCQLATYCDATCQAKGWNVHGHAHVCAMYAARREAGLLRTWQPLGQVEGLAEAPPEIILAITQHLPAGAVGRLLDANKHLYETAGVLAWRLMLQRDVPDFVYAYPEIDVHPKLWVLLQDIKTTDWASMTTETAALLYQRVVDVTARAMAIEFACAVEYCFREYPKLPHYRRTLARIGYIGIVHWNEPFARQMSFADGSSRTKDLELRNATTLFRLFEPSPMHLAPTRKPDSLPRDILAATASAAIPMQELVTALDVSVFDKESLWRPAFDFFRAILTHVELSATLALTNRDRMKNDDANNWVATQLNIDVPHFRWYTDQYPDYKLTGMAAESVSNLRHPYSLHNKYMGSIYKGLITGDVREFGRD
jgi:hypothetical protein